MQIISLSCVNYYKCNFIISIFFVYFIEQVIGPRLMQNRQPFELRKVLIVYNFLQVIFSCWLFYEASINGWFAGYSLRCQPVDYSRSTKALRVSIYFVYYSNCHYLIGSFGPFLDGAWLLVVFLLKVHRILRYNFLRNAKTIRSSVYSSCYTPWFNASISLVGS